MRGKSRGKPPFHPPQIIIIIIIIIYKIQNKTDTLAMFPCTTVCRHNVSSSNAWPHVFWCVALKRRFTVAPAIIMHSTLHFFVRNRSSHTPMHSICIICSAASACATLHHNSYWCPKSGTCLVAAAGGYWLEDKAFSCYALVFPVY